MSDVNTNPPLCSIVLPFSRRPIVMTTCRVSKPLIVFFAPVSFMLKSTSSSFAFGSFSGGAAGFCSCVCCLRASSSAFRWASSIRLRRSAKVVTL